jgi:hypothetical protein
VGIGRIDPHGFAELFARGLGVAGFEQRVGEILANIRPRRRNRDGFAKSGDRSIVIVDAQSIESFAKRLVSEVGLAEEGYGRQEKERESNREYPTSLSRDT